MPEPSLSMNAGTMSIEDDLPRTVRRERDARERAAREREMSGHGPGHGSGPGPSNGSGHGSGYGPQPMSGPTPMRGMDADDYDLPAPPATVTAFDVPFAKMALFLIKAVLAGIPALLLLGAILWCFGHVLQTFFPALLKLKIMIYVPPQ